MSTILIIDDDFAIQISLNLLLKQNQYSTYNAADQQEARAILKKTAVDLILLDMNFSLATTGKEGLDLLKEIKSEQPDLPIILITAWGSIDLAVEGMKNGAADFITKPWQNDNLLKSVETAMNLAQNTKAAEKISRSKLDQKYNFSDIIGEDPQFLYALENTVRVADTDASVLILGESGTGKELIAEAIHNNSLRKNQPFVKVNLGGISSSLFESEMFGHKRGAFTDAKYDRAGRFEMANRGTIFLDEIGELDLNSQVKLLRVLQDRSFEVLGSSQTKTVDIRVITATNRDLQQMVSDREFREDLFYRINLITVKLPPLRERIDDIPLLVEYFLKKFRIIYKKPELDIDKKAISWLKELSWPGNVRELKNLVERVVLISGKELLQLNDFSRVYDTAPFKASVDGLPAVGSMSVNEMEKAMIVKALKYHNNNLSKVAKSLGLSRGALYRRLDKFGINYET